MSSQFCTRKLDNLAKFGHLHEAFTLTFSVLNLAFSDLVVGLFLQQMFDVIISVRMKMAANGNLNFAVFCPVVLDFKYLFISSFLAHRF